MTDFRIKFLGLAAVASLFAGVSYGQTLNCPAQNTPGVYTASVANTSPAQAGPSAATGPLLLRAEGTTELVADIVVAGCAAGSTSVASTVSLFLSQPATSKPVGTPAVGSPQLTEATLLVTPTNAGTVGVGTGCTTTPSGTTVTTAGSISGNTVSFTPAGSFPTCFNMEVANIRVNATGTGATTSPVAVTESLFVNYNGQAAVNISGFVVGQALQSLVAPAFALTSTGSANANRGVNVICIGNTLSSSTGLPGTATFVMNIAETLGGFFKQGTIGSALTQVNEFGSYAPDKSSTGTIGTPTSGTRISLTFSGVPTAATLYLPVSVTVAGATLTLTSSTTGAFSAVSPVTTANVVNQAVFAPSNGVITAVYEVTTANSSTIQTFSIPGYVIFAANSVTPATITVLESYAPTGTTQIPNFAASSASPLTAETITACVSNLLFPFVTSQLGFDTGIAISNASADPFGRFGAVPAGTTAPAGACTLNFYGAGAPTPASVATPSIASGTTYAFVSSSVAPGFQGYVIAQCPFVGGHGFGFVTNLGSAGNSAVAQGYNALSMPASNSAGTARVAVLGAGNTEGLLQ